MRALCPRTNTRWAARRARPLTLLPGQDALAPSRQLGTSDSLTNLEALAPLELGARIEMRAALHSRFRHVVGRAVLLAMIYLGAWARSIPRGRRCVALLVALA